MKHLNFNITFDDIKADFQQNDFIVIILNYFFHVKIYPKTSIIPLHNRNTKYLAIQQLLLKSIILH